jgi:hypothetical protein
MGLRETGGCMHSKARHWFTSGRYSSSRWRYVFTTAFLGTTIEQYDFLLYGRASALVFKDAWCRYR